MKTLLISSALLLGGISTSLLLWKLFGGEHHKEAQIDFQLEKSSQGLSEIRIWDQIWTDEVLDKDKTKLGWIFAIARQNYDSEFQQILFHRRWKANGNKLNKRKDQQNRGNQRDFDGLREKRASSIVTYFCIFVLVLSLIRAALDMNSNLKKSRQEQENQTINLDSRRCSLNDFKLAQALLKKKEQCQRRAHLLRRAMTIVESPLAAEPPKPMMTPREKALSKSDAKLEKQSSLSEGSATDSPSKTLPQRSRFSSASPTPPHLRRMSFPALRRGSSMDVASADMDDMIAHHSPEVKRRMRLLYRH